MTEQPEDKNAFKRLPEDTGPPSATFTRAVYLVIGLLVVLVALIIIASIAAVILLLSSN